MDDLWPDIPALLAAWHERKDRAAARRAIAFLECELVVAIPAAARRSWPAEQLDDALRGYLSRLLERPLPRTPDDPRSYLRRGFTNWCHSLHRKEARERRLDAEIFSECLQPDPDHHGRRRRVASAMSALRIEDRVVLKMKDTPEWLDEEELAWLANRSGRDVEELRTLLVGYPDPFELTLLFEPETTAEDDRRHRLERFRRRHGRARDALRALLTEPK